MPGLLPIRAVLSYSKEAAHLNFFTDETDPSSSVVNFKLKHIIVAIGIIHLLFIYYTTILKDSLSKFILYYVELK